MGHGIALNRALFIRSRGARVGQKLAVTDFEQVIEEHCDLGNGATFGVLHQRVFGQRTKRRARATHDRDRFGVRSIYKRKGSTMIHHRIDKLVGGAVTVALALGAAAGPAEAAGNSVIHACYNTRTGPERTFGNLRILRPHGHCGSSEHPIAWNAAGVTGATGAAATSAASNTGAANATFSQ